MNTENKSVQRIGLAKRLAEELSSGACVIARIGDEVYRRKTNKAGSVGAHFRHNLDFANSFLKGIRNGRIDYGERERDVGIEEDREYALDRFGSAVMRLRRLPAETDQTPILVRSETDPDTWHESSAGRELEFIISHTIHHHALIAAKLAVFGVETEFVFGVAPSTLKFWETKDTDAAVAK